MSTLSRVTATVFATSVWLIGSVPAWAEGTILSGRFDGSEPVMGPLSDYGCIPTGQHGYRQSTFHVSTGGAYIFGNLFEELHSHEVSAVDYRVYEGGFNPAAPGQNAMTWHDNGSFDFTTGVTYTLVVQQCKNDEGAWVAGFVGPGPILSDSVAAVPQFTRGKFSASDPTMPLNPGSKENSRFKQSGPIRVSRDGTYYFVSMPFELGAQVSLQVYTEPVNTADPLANRVAIASRGVPLIALHAGQDYYFVTQWIEGDVSGEFLYVLAPPAPFRINPGLAGIWHNPDTPGQGFFLTVYEKLNQIFLGWFTYEQHPPAGDEYGHRWLTAFGPFEGPSADLDIEWTAGGAFNAAQPVPEQHVWGEMRLDFTDCSSGEVIYSFGPDDTGGYQVESIPIRRHTNDTVALCESLYAGPGVPGPL